MHCDYVRASAYVVSEWEMGSMAPLSLILSYERFWLSEDKFNAL